MFVDPDLLSEAVCRALAAEIRTAQKSQCAMSFMLYVIERTLPSILKDRCNVRKLQNVLKVWEVKRSWVFQILSGQ